MKLLFVTQALDLDDPTLSVYHGWAEGLAKRADSLIVICLKQGRHALPANVQVYSLGKEKGRAPAFVYALRFLSLVWRLRNKYDRVLVHMNQEYLLVAGLVWKVLHKPTYLWRNHYAGSWVTDVAASFCKKVFCTSKDSYTAKYKKTILMPVGVDLERFMGPEIEGRMRSSILFLARMAPSKHPEMLIEALLILKKKGTSFTATFAGSPLPEYEYYYSWLQQRAQREFPDRSIVFTPGVPNAETPHLFHTHNIFVNCSQSGMFDKTLFEAAASGCLVLARSEDFEERAGSEYYFTDAESLAERMGAMLEDTSQETKRAHMQSIAKAEGLDTLMDRLIAVI
ncbi:MAG: hypothetical protein AB202_03850 [Parcubacteria bacterium C7867-007]|nr:MAG: hypothetical protein AB202_03850 [Parcubacteria bacterium C7867-007]